MKEKIAITFLNQNCKKKISGLKKPKKWSKVTPQNMENIGNGSFWVTYKKYSLEKYHITIGCTKESQL